MKPQFDDKDAQLLAKREALYNQHAGPRVGDYVTFPDHHVERFSHDWGDRLQTTDAQFGASFCLTRQGEVSFSGGLNPAIPKARITDTGKLMRGVFWMFHHNERCAGNSVDVDIACRVYNYAGEEDHEAPGGE